MRHKLTHQLCAQNKLIFAAAAPKTAVTWIFSHVCDLKCSWESRKSADSTHGKSQSSRRHQDIPENTRSRSINIPADTWPTAQRNQAIEPAATYLLNFLEEKCPETSETSVSHQSACTDSNVFHWTQVGGKLRERRREWERERAMGWEFSFSFFFMDSHLESCCSLSLLVSSPSLLPTMPSGSQPSNEFQALLWSTCAAWHQSQMKWETEGDDGKRRMRKSNCHETERNAPLTPATYTGIVYYPHTTMHLTYNTEDAPPIISHFTISIFIVSKTLMQ